MGKTSFMELYARYLREMRIRVPPLLYMLFALIFSIVASAVLYLLLAPILPLTLTGVLEPVARQMSYIFPALLFVVLLDVLIGYPFWKGTARVEEIEKNLADALKQMADTLRAGGTYEFALREVAVSEYGALTEELNKVLRKLEEGESFEKAMRTLSEEVSSRLIDRTVTVIIDAIKSGAGLADVLEDISEDVRESNRVETERKSRTLMQMLFMIATGSIVAPYIFGVISALIVMFTQSASGFDISPTQVAASMVAGDQIILLLQIYILIEVLASSVMISLMREGKLSKTVVYFPILLFLAFFIFYVARIFATSILLGGFT
jgi:pilus assembly protein TadC